MKKLIIGTVLAALLGVAPVQARQPFDKDHFGPEGEAETSVWELSREWHRENLKRKAVSPVKTEVDHYLQRVMDKLYPEFAGKFTVRLMMDAGSNAFALPSGVIYVGGGMLMRMTSEAQLAGLLAHEGSHVTHRHGVETHELNEIVTGTVSVVNAVVKAIPVPALTLTEALMTPVMKGLVSVGVNFSANTSIFGFSRMRETEADTEGFARLVKAGYHPAEASVLFKELAREAQVAGINSMFFFSSHPAMEARVENFERLIAESKTTSGFVGKDEFEAVIGKHRKAYVEQEFKRLNGLGAENRTLVAFFTRSDINQLLEPVDVAYFKAEALVRMAKTEELEEALEAYRTAIQLGVPFEKVAEQLILIHLRKKDGKSAKEVLEAWAAAGKSKDDLGYQAYVSQANELLK